MKRPLQELLRHACVCTSMHVHRVGLTPNITLQERGNFTTNREERQQLEVCAFFTSFFSLRTNSHTHTHLLHRRHATFNFRTDLCPSGSDLHCYSSPPSPLMPKLPLHIHRRLIETAEKAERLWNQGHLRLCNCTNQVV